MVQGNRSRSQKRNNARRNSKQNKRGGANMFSSNNPSFAVVKPNTLTVVITSI